MVNDLELWQAVILGLVEGITEYLPVSSTGHLIIASGLMGLTEPAQKSAIDAFNIVIQGGAILAVLGLYWPRVKQMILGVLGKDPEGLGLAINIFVAFLPAAVLGLLLDEHIERWLFALWPVAAALFLGGIFMIAVERLRKRHTDKPSGRSALRADADMPDGHSSGSEHELIEPGREMTIERLTWKHALIIGFLQVIAMWPGTSRSMMTITGGVLVGLKPRQAAEFSFLLGLPTLGGATVYKLFKNLKDSSEAGVPNMFEQLGVLPIVIGLIVATISAALAVRWLVAFLNDHGLTPFGVYRIVLCIVLVGLVLGGVIETF